MDSITKTLRLPISKSRAFEHFVTNINKWWPPEYTWSGKKLNEIRIEPEENGLCTEIGPNNFRCDWGSVTIFKKPEMLAFKWQISPQRIPEPDPDKASEVTITFKEEESGSVMHFEHTHFENHGEGSEGYQQAMNSKQGWDYILSKYAEFCSYN